MMKKYVQVSQGVWIKCDGVTLQQDVMPFDIIDITLYLHLPHARCSSFYLRGDITDCSV